MNREPIVSPRKRWSRSAGWGLLALGVLFQAHADDGTITNCTESALKNALARGGVQTFTCTGTVSVATQLTVANTVTLKAAPGQIVIQGGGTNRLFLISGGGSLTLDGLELAGGADLGLIGADGAEAVGGSDGGVAQGGAVLVQPGGILRGWNLTFTTNRAVGGDGGDGGDGAFAADGPGNGGRGGAARGGAIANLAGSVELSNCLFQANSAKAGAGGAGGDGLTGHDGADGGDAGVVQGGAIFSNGGDLQVARCTFSFNGATAAEGGSHGLPDPTGLFYYPGHIGQAGAASGGAIHAEGGGVVRVADCTLGDNQAIGAAGLDGVEGGLGSDDVRGGDGTGAAGGGLSRKDGSLTLTNCVFRRNKATGGAGGNGGSRLNTGDGGDGGAGGSGMGGATAVFSSLAGTVVSIVDCSFETNQVQGSTPGQGGQGIGGFLSVNGKNGAAGGAFGAAVYLEVETAGIWGCLFEGNTGEAAAGAAGWVGRDFQRGETGSPGGTASGGGIYNQKGTLGVTNATFYVNDLKGGQGGTGGDGGTGRDGGDGGSGGGAYGGGVCNAFGTITMICCTLSANSATGGAGGTPGEGSGELTDPGDPGAIGIHGGGAIANLAGGFNLVSSILNADAGVANAGGTIADGGFNVSSDGSAGSPAADGIELEPPADHGGRTRTMRPTGTNNPAYDQGSCVIQPPVDQRGLYRVPPFDIGAFERDAIAEPSLNVRRSAGEELIISWPGVPHWTNLQQTLSLSSPVWTHTPLPVLQDNAWVFTTPTSAGGERYYRLQY